MNENEQMLSKKISEELAAYIRDHYMIPTHTTQNYLEDMKQKVQWLCRMAYEGGFSDTNYTVDLKFHEETGDVEVILTEVIPVKALYLCFNYDNGEGC